MTPDRTRARDLERLAEFGEPGGPDLDEALRLFALLRQTADERRAIETLRAQNAKGGLPDAILVALAVALIERGDDESAKHALARSNSTQALMVRADLFARGAELSSAIALAERVLLRDIDWPGARERHARWRDELGPATPARHVDATETLLAGEAQAPYELVREVGRGGSAVVYEARDRELGRQVALKVYHRPQSDRPQLLHEARVAVTLAGTGIVRVFDVDPDGGWLAIEWAGLAALRALIRADDSSSLFPVSRWAGPLARSLAHVHAAGWVHNDVKPANVLFAVAGAPLLGDFGTARPIGEPSPPGSLGYLSPERLAGRASDPRDDVYGFGRILEDAFHALAIAGDPLHRGADANWRALAASCTGPDERRPRDGTDLLARVPGDERE